MILGRVENGEKCVKSQPVPVEPRSKIEARLKRAEELDLKVEDFDYKHRETGDCIVLDYEY